jgi:hypothetical protein
MLMFSFTEAIFTEKGLLHFRAGRRCANEVDILLLARAEDLIFAHEVSLFLSR